MIEENVKSVIERLERINPEEEFAYEKAILAYRSLPIVPIISHKIPAGTNVFRTRTNEKNDFFQTVSDISIAPNQFVKSFARCNRPFQSKFYCSENRPTSFMELVEYWAETKAIGDKVYITLSRWALLNDLTTIIVTTPKKQERTSGYDKFHGQAMDNFIENLVPEIKDATVLFYRYLFDKFRASAKHDPQTYLITTAYCNLTLSCCTHGEEGILYPSVPFIEQGVNIAINSSYATSENLELISVNRYELTVRMGDAGNFDFIETKSHEARKIDTSQDLVEW